VGYRHIDCATAYGNHDEVGKGLQRAFKDGLVKREDLWITCVSLPQLLSLTMTAEHASSSWTEHGFPFNSLEKSYIAWLARC
jgi:diketogulonate reductase-like aldo/keto reductase